MGLVKLFKRDEVPLGFFLGLFFPLTGFCLFYIWKIYPLGEGFAEYLHLFKTNVYLIPKILSLSVLSNALIFFLYTQFRKDRTSRGILIATLIYAVVIIWFKL